MIRKTLALAISFSLLGQSILWAAPAAQETQPRTLAEYQQQAKNDMQKLSWIGEKAFPFTLTLLIVSGIGVAISKRPTQVQAEMQKKLNEVKNLHQDRIAGQQRKIAELEIRANQFPREVSGLQTLNRLKKEDWERKTGNLQKALQDVVNENYRLTERLGEAEALNYIPQGIQDIISKYEALIDPRTSNSKYNLLKRQILEETGLKTASQEERMAFITILDRTREITTVSGKKSATDFMVAALTKHTKNNFPSFYYLKEFLTRLSKSSGVLSVGLLAFLAFSASDAKAAAMTQRVQKNFDLFLNASAEELAEMEKNPQLRETCIQGAQAVHYLSTLPKEELENLRNAFPEAAPARPAINLAR